MSASEQTALQARTYHIPDEAGELRTRLMYYESELAATRVMLTNCEAQLNQLNDWLMIHGYGEPDRNPATRVIKVLESHLGVCHVKKLSMLAHTVEEDFQHFLSHRNVRDLPQAMIDLLREAFEESATIGPEEVSCL